MVLERKPPPAGWCQGEHADWKAAQSGYRGPDGRMYCKACFHKKFPELYELKRDEREKLKKNVAFVMKFPHW